MRYSELENNYLAAKSEYLNEVFTRPEDITLDIVWDGDRQNPNAALTIFRHFDIGRVVHSSSDGQRFESANLLGTFRAGGYLLKLTQHR